jgi:DNA polymerase III alpha subunit
MAGKTVTLVGQVSSHRSGLTRDGKPFAAVALDLLGGSIEVMVWSNAYEKTQELWYEGSLVEVVGKVRLRDDEVSVHCDEAKPYRIEDNNGHSSQGEERMPTSELTTRTVNGTPPSADVEPRANGASAPSRTKLWIRLEESTDPGKDEHLLREVVKLLMNHPGSSPVALRIKTDGKVVIGELPLVSVSYCEELHQDLVAMVGEGAVEVEGGGGGPA